MGVDASQSLVGVEVVVAVVAAVVALLVAVVAAVDIVVDVHAGCLRSCHVVHAITTIRHI